MLCYMFDGFVDLSGAAAPWTTTVYSSKSLDGPWTAHVDVLGNITQKRLGTGWTVSSGVFLSDQQPALGSQNVSPIMEKDGSVKLMFKGPVYFIDLFADCISPTVWTPPRLRSSPCITEDPYINTDSQDNNTEASIAIAPHWTGPYTLAHVNIFGRYFDIEKS